jgi:hypothetical protein
MIPIAHINSKNAKIAIKTFGKMSLVPKVNKKQ